MKQETLLASPTLSWYRATPSNGSFRLMRCCLELGSAELTFAHTRQDVNIRLADDLLALLH